MYQFRDIKQCREDIKAMNEAMYYQLKTYGKIDEELKNNYEMAKKWEEIWNAGRGKKNRK